MAPEGTSRKTTDPRATVTISPKSAITIAPAPSQHAWPPVIRAAGNTAARKMREASDFAALRKGALLGKADSSPTSSILDVDFPDGCGALSYYAIMGSSKRMPGDSATSRASGHTHIVDECFSDRGERSALSGAGINPSVSLRKDRTKDGSDSATKRTPAASRHSWRSAGEHSLLDGR